jgi:rubrerythrin
LHEVKYGEVDTGSHARYTEEGVKMRDVEAAGREPTGDFVDFLSTGAHVKGEFHCSGCGYGVTVYRALPVCPMCGGNEWEQSAWSPLTRARSIVQ